MKKDLFIEQIKETCRKTENGYVIAQCTDRLLVGKANENTDWENIYEYGFDIRIFDEVRENRWFRGTIADDFIHREKEDTADLIEGVDYIDETQFLDIDDKATDTLHAEGDVMAIGGGRYHLPVSNTKDAKLKIRNYLSYEENGRVYISDWRCMTFMEGGKENG